MSDLLGIEDVMKAGTPSFQERFSFEDEGIEERSYGKKIPVARDVSTGEVVSVPFDNMTRVLLCAKSRQGKTVLGKRFLSCLVKKGGNVFCGSDIKNDFQSWNGTQGSGEGVSKELVRKSQGLLQGESPEDFPRVLAIPYFLRQYYEDDPDSGDPKSYGTLFSLDFHDINRNDFRYLIEYDSWRSDSQRDIIDDILFEIDSMSELTWGFLENRLDEEGRSGEKIWKRIRKLKRNNVISSKGESLNSILDWDGGDLVSLSLKYIEPASDRYIRFYASVFHREVVKYRKGSSQSVPFVIFDDEVHEICPASEDSRVKDELALLFSRKAGQAGVATVFSSQEPRKIPSVKDRGDHDFVSDTTHAFVGRGLNWEDYRIVFSVFDFYDSNNTQPLRDMKNSLDQHQFMYMDKSMKDVGDIKIVESLAPLVAHPG